MVKRGFLLILFVSLIVPSAFAGSKSHGLEGALIGVGFGVGTGLIANLSVSGAGAGCNGQGVAVVDESDCALIRFLRVGVWTIAIPVSGLIGYTIGKNIPKKPKVSIAPYIHPDPKNLNAGITAKIYF